MHRPQPQWRAQFRRRLPSRSALRAATVVALLQSDEFLRNGKTDSVPPPVTRAQSAGEKAGGKNVGSRHDGAQSRRKRRDNADFRVAAQSGGMVQGPGLYNGADGAGLTDGAFSMIGRIAGLTLFLLDSAPGCLCRTHPDRAVEKDHDDCVATCPAEVDISSCSNYCRCVNAGVQRNFTLEEYTNLATGFATGPGPTWA